MPSLLDAALQYLDRGWSVFPTINKRASVQWKQHQYALPTPEMVRSYEWCDGIAVALGEVSGIVRVDADGDVPEDKLRGLEQTLEFDTPSGGHGWLYKYLEGIRTEVLWKGGDDHCELRVQSTGAYTLVPPSPGYSWTRLREPAVSTLLLERAAGHVLEAEQRKINPALRDVSPEELRTVLSHVDWDDRDSWLKAGFALQSMDENNLDLWIEYSRTSPKFKESECEKMWAQMTPFKGIGSGTLFWLAKRNGFRSAKSLYEPLTDKGYAATFARMHSDRIKYSPNLGWLVWDGTRWNNDSHAPLHVQSAQKEVLDARYNIAAHSLYVHLTTDRAAPDFEEKRKRKTATLKHMRMHESNGKIQAAINLVKDERLIQVDQASLDTHPMLLTCPNGVVDLETGTLKDAIPELMISQCAATEHHPSAFRGTWERFVEDILPDESVRRFMQLFLGTCLTGDTRAQVFPILIGNGANGKTTLVNVVMRTLGSDYCMKAAREVMLTNRAGVHCESVARLRGKRLVVCSESDEGRRLSEERVKELTGGDAVTARHLYKSEFEFLPTHKMFLVTNSEPDVRGTDEGIWRRIALIRFTQQFLPGDPKRDEGMEQKLLQEKEGVLSWMVDGCLEWVRAGKKLEVPEAVKAASREYRQEQDQVAAFLDDRLEVGEGRVSSTELQVTYNRWVSETGRDRSRLTLQMLGRKLTEKGFSLSDDRRYRIGLRLKPRS